MKTLGIWIAALGITFTACGQDIAANKVPSVVTNALHAKFTTATNADWELKNGVYEAEFKQDSLEYTVEIDAAGKITRQKHDLSVQLLPQNIAQAIASQYKGLEIEDVEKMEVGGNVLYQVELEARGKKDVQLVFDGNGAASNVSFWE